jgi:hypothetical protein
MRTFYCNVRFLIALGLCMAHQVAVFDHGAPGWTLVPSCIAVLVWNYRSTKSELGW